MTNTDPPEPLFMSDLQGLVPGSDRYEEVEAKLLAEFADQQTHHIRREALDIFLDTVQSARSVACTQMTRLLQYYLFSDLAGQLPPLKALAKENFPEHIWDRLSAISRYVSLRYGATLTPGEELESERARLLAHFPGLSLCQLGKLCGATRDFVRAEQLRSLFRQEPTVPMTDVAACLTYLHGPGYAAIEAGRFKSLEGYVANNDLVLTEAAHHTVLHELRKLVSQLEIARYLHPVVFLSKLAGFKRVQEEIAKELAASKKVWEVSTGQPKLDISDSLDAMLHIAYLRLRTGKSKNSRVDWQAISETARLEQLSNEPEHYARKLWGEFTQQHWHPSFANPAPTPENEGGLQLLCAISSHDLVTLGARIEAIIKKRKLEA